MILILILLLIILMGLSYLAFNETDRNILICYLILIFIFGSFLAYETELFIQSAQGVL